MSIELIQGDAKEVLQNFGADHFDAACFSPPYGLASEGFDVRRDFKPGGRFLPYMFEICRVSGVVAVNFTQRVADGELSVFTEELVLTLKRDMNIHLFDRWVMVKPTAMPKRGNRALTNYEFVLLFSRHPKLVQKREGVDDNQWRTVIQAKGRHNASAVKALGTTPYAPEIPHQVFSLYGHKRVLDPFAGSGTSLVVARQLGLSAVGIELNEQIFEQTTKNLGIQ